jgi:trigger factor
MPIDNQEEIEYCKLKVQYTADPAVVSEKRLEALNQFRKMPISGFRPGKAPHSVLKLKFKKQIDTSVKQEMVSQAYDEVLYETGITPIGYPNVLDSNLSGNNFSCELLFLKKPDFELQKYKEFEIPEPHMPKTADDVAEELLQRIRDRNADVQPYGDEDFVQAGDKVTCDIESQEHGKDKVFVEGHMFVVGNSEFDGNLFGMKPGEMREFDLVDAAKTRIHIKFTLHMGLKPIPCSDNEELAKRVNYESFEKLRADIAATAANQVDNQRKALISDQIKKRLLEAHDFKVPEWLSSMEAQNIASQEGIKWDEITDDVRESYINQAAERAKLSFIYDSIRKVEPETQMSDEEIRNYLTRMAAMQGLDPQKALVEAQSQGRLLGMAAALRDEAVTKWLVEKSKVIA